MGKASRMKKVRSLQKQAILKVYETVAPAIYEKYFTPNCCLNATRAFLEVAKHFKLPAEPLATQTAVFSPKFWELVNEHRRFPKDRDELIHWTDVLGGWSLGIGPTTYDGYEHHLIAMSGKTIIDSSAGQFRREEKNMFVPTVLVGEPLSRFGKLWLETPRSTVIGYFPEPEVQDFRHISGFNNPYNLDIAQLIIEAMENYR